jgi:hypothetical protein
MTLFKAREAVCMVHFGVITEISTVAGDDPRINGSRRAALVPGATEYNDEGETGRQR